MWTEQVGSSPSAIGSATSRCGAESRTRLCFGACVAWSWPLPVQHPRDTPVAWVSRASVEEVQVPEGAESPRQTGSRFQQGDSQTGRPGGCGLQGRLCIPAGPHLHPSAALQVTRPLGPPQSHQQHHPVPGSPARVSKGRGEAGGHGAFPQAAPVLRAGLGRDGCTWAPVPEAVLPGPRAKTKSAHHHHGFPECPPWAPGDSPGGDSRATGPRAAPAEESVSTTRPGLVPGHRRGGRADGCAAACRGRCH